MERLYYGPAETEPMEREKKTHAKAQRRKGAERNRGAGALATIRDESKRRRKITI